jgi:hypothetical protein
MRLTMLRALKAEIERDSLRNERDEARDERDVWKAKAETRGREGAEARAERDAIAKRLENALIIGADLRAERDTLHTAICQAVTVMNVGDHRQGHDILRAALVAYADAALRDGKA